MVALKVALVFLVSVLGIPRPVHAAEGTSDSYLPAILEFRPVSVEAGKVYRFPWLDAKTPCQAGSPGCFRVLSVANSGARIRFTGFTVVNGHVQRNGFIREPVIGPGATSSELFSIKTAPGPRETWVHAYHRPGTNQVVFFSRPAFVTRKAKLERRIVVDLRAKAMEETTRVDAREPLTLIASGPVEKALPGAVRKEITVNGQRPLFRFSSFLDLNLSPGISSVRTRFRWRQLPDEICPWSLYEGKKMSLPTKTELSLLGLNKNRRYEIRLSMFGITESVWRRFQPVLATDPEPQRRARVGLSERLIFENTERIALSFRPLYFHRTGKRGATFPVIVCFREAR